MFAFLRAAAALVAATAALLFAVERAAAATYGHAAIVQRTDGTVFERDGEPFFLYGAAFFYERLPRERWGSAMDALARLGINTLDLYVPWNWHEIADGDFDFDGRTNPRRDLHGLLRLARAHGFAIVLRPGPVVRNEWRNGGYPAWLLARPAYGMPPHDLLEGRYPPTATLQNAHSDDAAAQWLGNATHLRYARRWLERVLRECAPASDLVLAVALDDDQGAYIDNATWPAPHLVSYLDWLRGVVWGVTGPREPVFINTYQMKVTASSPVWAMGNWYQSDAYALGDHDRAQLELSFGMLATRPEQPLMASEFQAGWLQGPADARPRPADPSNTGLALATMVGMGVRGVVNFPAQDTLDPAGWEAPFANAFYAWDAALALDRTPSPRAEPTREFGTLVTFLGPQLAASHVLADAAIAYLGGSFAPGRTSNALVAEAAARVLDAQQACRRAGRSCAVVDPHAISQAALDAYGTLVVPHLATPGAPPRDGDVDRRLRAFAAHGGRIVASANGASGFAARAVTGADDATFASDPTHALDGFLTLANYGARERRFAGALIVEPGGRRIAVPAFVVPAHRGRVLPVGVRLARLGRGYRANDTLAFTDCMADRFERDGARLRFTRARDLVASTCTYWLHVAGVDRRVAVRPGEALAIAPTGVSLERARDDAPNATATGIPIRNDAVLEGRPFRPVPRRESIGYRSDVYGEGALSTVLDNGEVRLVVSPEAGARAFVFEDDRTGRNVFSPVGGLRDDVAIEPPLSKVDRIARYTHDFPAGTFNRQYDVRLGDDAGSARATFTYAAPDVVPHGAAFVRDVSLAPRSRAFTVDERFTLAAANDPRAAAQRAQSVTALVVGDGTDMTTRRVLWPAARAFAAGTSGAVDVAASNGLGYYDLATHELAAIAWRAGDVERATIDERASSIVVRLTLAPYRTTHVRYASEIAPSVESASGVLDANERAAQTPREDGDAGRAPGRPK